MGYPHIVYLQKNSCKKSSSKMSRHVFQGFLIFWRLRRQNHDCIFSGFLTSFEKSSIPRFFQKKKFYFSLSQIIRLEIWLDTCISDFWFGPVFDKIFAKIGRFVEISTNGPLGVKTLWKNYRLFFPFFLTNLPIFLQWRQFKKYV